MKRLVLSRSVWLLLGAMAVAAIVASGWVSRTRTLPDLPEAPPPRADYYLRDAEVDVMDESGQLSYRMQARELLRFNDRTARLTDVHIESLGGTEGVWQLEARQAMLYEQQERMVLSDGVRMLTQGPHGNIRLSTRNLQVELKTKRMATTDPVSIEGPGYETQAVGMQAGFRSRTLILLNKVQTRYAP